MKNFMTLTLVLASLTFAVAGCSDNKTTTETTATETIATTADSAAVPAAEGMVTTYTCPMHPEVASSQSGECPKCHMDLVAKK